LVPAELTNAHLSAGVWTVDLKGLWPFYLPPLAYLSGSPTPEPMLYTTCQMRIDAETGRILEGSVGGEVKDSELTPAPTTTSPPPSTLAARLATAADVAAFATDCSGFRVGEAVVKPEFVSASLSAGVWTVELKGLWHFNAPSYPVPAGLPTPEPLYLTSCTMRIDAETGQLRGVEGETAKASELHPQP
jgi:hypothetical protein